MLTWPALAQMPGAMAGDDMTFIPEDLAPGDMRALGMDRRGFQVERIESVGHPLFEAAYGRLWAEFGAAHEMEARAVIEQRLAWHPARATGECWLRYELLLVRREAQLVAVRDHTAIVSAELGQAMVHLSHVLVEPEWRRTGLAGWLRAWPIQTARSCLAAAGFPITSPIALLAEMEHPDPGIPARLIRLQAYEKAGFKKADPSLVPYVQPDFRPPAEIHAGGGPRPLPFGLILRRVGLEREDSIRAGDLKEMVKCMYRMYGQTFRPADMEAVWNSLPAYPGDGTQVRLMPPTQ